MKLEQMTASIENCQKLSELGVTVGSYFSHNESKIVRGVFSVQASRYVHPMDNLLFIAPAYTVAELDQMLALASDLIIEGKRFIMEATYPWEECDCFGIGLLEINGSLDQQGWGKMFHDSSNGENGTECRALMLIWLIEEGHITVEEINE